MKKNAELVRDMLKAGIDKENRKLVSQHQALLEQASVELMRLGSDMDTLLWSDYTHHQRTRIQASIRRAEAELKIIRDTLSLSASS